MITKEQAVPQTLVRYKLNTLHPANIHTVKSPEGTGLVNQSIVSKRRVLCPRTGKTIEEYVTSLSFFFCDTLNKSQLTVVPLEGVLEVVKTPPTSKRVLDLKTGGLKPSDERIIYAPYSMPNTETVLLVHPDGHTAPAPTGNELRNFISPYFGRKEGIRRANTIRELNDIWNTFSHHRYSAFNRLDEKPKGRRLYIPNGTACFAATKELIANVHKHHEQKITHVVLRYNTTRKGVKPELIEWYLDQCTANGYFKIRPTFDEDTKSLIMHVDPDINANQLFLSLSALRYCYEAIGGIQWMQDKMNDGYITDFDTAFLLAHHYANWCFGHRYFQAVNMMGKNSYHLDHVDKEIVHVVTMPELINMILFITGFKRMIKFPELHSYTKTPFESSGTAVFIDHRWMASINLMDDYKTIRSNLSKVRIVNDIIKLSNQLVSSTKGVKNV